VDAKNRISTAEGYVHVDEGVIAGRFKRIDDYSIWSLEMFFSKAKGI